MANISYQEYLEFFCYEEYYYEHNFAAFNKKTFNKLVPYLKDDSYIFWTSLFSNFSPLKIRKSNKLFTRDELPCQALKQSITYLNEENYPKLKEKASTINIKFINSDITNLESTLTEDFDFIYLSNIIQYVESIYRDDADLTVGQSKRNKLQNYKNMTENLAKKLKEDGQMVVGYFYEPNCIRKNITNIIYDVEARKAIFDDSAYSYHYFPSINTIDFKSLYGFCPDPSEDACLVYQKNNKKR